MCVHPRAQDESRRRVQWLNELMSVPLSGRYRVKKRANHAGCRRPCDSAVSRPCRREALPS